MGLSISRNMYEWRMEDVKVEDMKVRHVLDGKGITGPLLETRKQRKFLRV